MRSSAPFIRDYPTLFGTAERLAAPRLGQWTLPGLIRKLLCRYVDRIANLEVNAELSSIKKDGTDVSSSLKMKGCYQRHVEIPSEYYLSRSDIAGRVFLSTVLLSPHSPIVAPCAIAVGRTRHRARPLSVHRRVIQSIRPCCVRESARMSFW